MRRSRTIVPAITALLVIVTGVVAPAPAGAAEADERAADAAIAWLADQPTSGFSLEQRIDLALAYQVGGAPSTLIDPLLNEIEFLLGQGAEASNKLLAKAVVTLDIGGRSATVAGGTRDLIAELQAAVGSAPHLPGQYPADPGDEISTQAWGIIAEARTGTSPQAAADFLMSQQCPDGTVVSSPTVQACARTVNVADQALALTALVTAGRTGVDVTDAQRLLLEWVGDRWKPDGAGEGDWADLGVSALSRLAWPLAATDNPAMAADVARQVRSLQLTEETATHGSHLGAIGGETAALLQDLQQQRLDPAPGLTISALHALWPVDLATHRHEPRAELANLLPPGPSVVGPERADPGQAVRFLAQGFTPGQEIRVTVSGMQGTVATARADESGSAILDFTAQALDVTGQELTISGAPDEQVTRTLSVLRPLADKADSSGGPTRTGAGVDAGLFELSLAQAVVVGALLLALLVAGALLLRPDR